MTPCTGQCARPTPSQCHCANCHRTFGGIRGFDAHRTGGNCHQPKGYVEVKGIWRLPITTEALARRTGESLVD